MFGSAFRYLVQHPVRALSAIVSQPLETGLVIRERLIEAREHRLDPEPFKLYRSEPKWAEQLHDGLGISFPCASGNEFNGLWHQVVEELTVRGLRVGPESYLKWNDGDAALVRAIWCLIRHCRPIKIVETGVAHGVTSRFILEALQLNGAGFLWSIDRAPLNHEFHSQIGAAVAGRDFGRWSYIKGSSRLQLPGLLSNLDQIDLFIHDSMHSAQNVLFEMNQAWSVLRRRGALVIDDIDLNKGFHAFVQAHPGYVSLVCESEPLRPDLRRFNGKGLFGIVLKQRSALPLPS